MAAGCAASVPRAYCHSKVNKYSYRHVPTKPSAFAFRPENLSNKSPDRRRVGAEVKPRVFCRFGWAIDTFPPLLVKAPRFGRDRRITRDLCHHTKCKDGEVPAEIPK